MTTIDDLEQQNKQIKRQTQKEKLLRTASYKGGESNNEINSFIILFVKLLIDNNLIDLIK